MMKCDDLFDHKPIERCPKRDFSTSQAGLYMCKRFIQYGVFVLTLPYLNIIMISLGEIYDS